MSAPCLRASPRAASFRRDTAETSLSRCQFRSAPPERDRRRRGKAGLTLAALSVSYFPRRWNGHDWRD
jgi:hypothetical protein